MSSNIYESAVQTSGHQQQTITEYVYRVNLEMNFVNNYRMKVGDFAIAKGYFENVANNHPTHAFAHYYLARAHEGLGSDPGLIRSHREAFATIIRDNGEWAGHARAFGLA